MNYAPRRSGSPVASLQWGLRAADFDYELPESLIAQRPLPQRPASRLLVLDRRSGTWTDSRFRSLPDHVGSGDCLVVNNTRVLAARLLGRRLAAGSGLPGGSAEILVLEPSIRGAGTWKALVRPGRRLPPGARVEVAGREVRVMDRLPDGVRIVDFVGLDGAAVERFLEEQGRVPLPPYIRRDDDETDRDRYQTVFASQAGSVAAPTAGLHFDDSLVRAVRDRGAEFAEITLHVGPGTFRPVSAERAEDHRMHSERFEIPRTAAAAVRSARRTIAVGTTSVRALETAARAGGAVRPTAGETDLFITPGFRFRAVNALLTNFHLPRSTLLMLVAAFAGRELVLEAYAHAAREEYRFYSYGDCMLIV